MKDAAFKVLLTERRSAAAAARWSGYFFFSFFTPRERGSSHLPSNNSVFHCRAAADAVFSSSSSLSLSLSLFLSPSLFLPSLSLSLSLSLSHSLPLPQIDSPFSRRCAATAGNENCLRNLQVDDGAATTTTASACNFIYSLHFLCFFSLFPSYMSYVV